METEQSYHTHKVKYSEILYGIEPKVFKCKMYKGGGGVYNIDHMFKTSQT